MHPRAKLILSAALTSLLLLSACQSPVQPSESTSPSPSQSGATEVITTPEPTPTPAPEPSEPICPTLSNMQEVSAFLNEQAERGNLELSLIYKGNSSRINDQSLMEVLACLHVGVEKDKENRKMFHITVTPYPGDRIAAAYLSGDTSGLSEEEMQVLNTAARMVEQAKSISSTPLELERALHDMLTDRVEYTDYAVKIHDPSQFPRQITVIGALLDGIANCQGYTDAFYTLTTMAGLQTDRMCVLKNVDEPYLVNLIQLDGAWYTVDAAYNDSDAAHPAYLLFNMGRNLKLVYDWGPELEYHPVAPVRYEYKDVYTDEVPQIANLTEFRQYYNQQFEQDIFDIVFDYTGDPDDFDDLGAYQLADSNASALFTYPDQETRYCITLMEHPGYRIVDAYRTGDTSLLDADELLTLNEAIRLVNEAKAQAGSDLELERILHDMLAEKVIYDTSIGTTILDVREPLRHLTAVGALLDGIANCQGYTDGFYVLASIAGFEVNKMVVGAYNPGDHITNVIKLDGAWYIVDVTFDDSPNVLPYFMFNVGVDIASEHYSWGVEAVDQPLAEASDEHYYYYMEGNELDSFETQAAAADFIIDAYRKTGQTEFIVMLLNQEASPTAFNQRVNQIAERKDISCGWSLWTFPHGEHTVFRLVFQPEE